ncbi:MAG TPA: 2-amino-4-hydroxy-6-hydroxymethyldihydropteridine diphosphokinase [Galbitalea sp.]|nr:2-amino-4-hydroxy-6-hydroxymethyldihydropteridine diphosphokinase [Galbitalea sp.]
MSEGVRAILSLGSNLGDRESILRAAIADVGALDGVEVLAVSSIVQTAAVKPHGIDESAPAYLNLVIEVLTNRSAGAFLASTNGIERQHGRVREVAWGDRTLDIDIITMADLQLNTDALTLPHPRAADRGFVLVPWLEIDPDASLPGIGRVDRLPAAHEDVRRYRAEADS